MIRSWLERNLKGDYQIWIIVFLLSCISLAVVYSARGTSGTRLAGPEHFLFRQIFNIGITFALMWACHRVNFARYAGLSRLGMMLSVILLIVTMFFGEEHGGARRMLNLKVFSFMPSDLAKFSLIANLAAMLAKRQNVVFTPRIMMPLVIWCGVIGGLIAANSGSTALLLWSTCGLLMFIGRVPAKYFRWLGGAVLVAGLLAWTFGSRGDTWGSRFGTQTNTLSQTLSKVTRYFSGDPETQALPDDRIDTQEEYSVVAVASGGTLGRGPGRSIQRNFMKEAYSDFIFAIIVEEYGLAGGVFVLFLYLWLLYRGIRWAARADRAYGALLSAGLSFSLVLQALVHMAVSVQLIPVTGQTLPLVSWGGSSLLFTGVSIGVILSVSRAYSTESTPPSARVREPVAA
jgi:cell division protein FtsW